MAREGDPDRPGRGTQDGGAPIRNDQSGVQRAGSGDTENLATTFLLLGRLAGVGWFIAISIAGGAIGGYYLDLWLDTSPWLTLSGLALGGAVAFTGLFRLLKSFSGGRKPNKK